MARLVQEKKSAESGEEREKENKLERGM